VYSSSRNVEIGQHKGKWYNKLPWCLVEGGVSGVRESGKILYTFTSCISIKQTLCTSAQEESVKFKEYDKIR